MNFWRDDESSADRCEKLTHATRYLQPSHR